jgi:hypothetical protein
MNPIIQFIGKNVKPRLERFNKAIPTFKVYLQKKLPTFQQGVCGINVLKFIWY